MPHILCADERLYDDCLQGISHLLEEDLKTNDDTDTTALAQPAAADTTAPAIVDATPQPTSFLSLPGELRNRIYDLSGALQTYQYLYHWRGMTTVRGDYTTGDHGRVHHCASGAACPVAEWDEFFDWPVAKVLVNPSITTNRRSQSAPSISCSFNHWHQKHTRRSVSTGPASPRPPDLTRVSKRFRPETLSLFYGNHPFVIRLIDGCASDEERALQWLDLIGTEAASHLRQLYVVHSKKRQAKQIHKFFLRELSMRGVRTSSYDLGVVRLLRVAPPSEYTDEEVVRAVAE